MEYIIPVSEMRYYNQTLSEVREGSQVILTRNGKAEYAMVDIDEWNTLHSRLKLLEELHSGYLSLNTETTVSRDEFRESFGIKS